jgi:nicotinamidase-related amidase
MATQLGTVTTAHDPGEVARQPLQAEKCSLVVIDIQQKLLPPIYEKERLLRNAQLLLRLAKIVDLPVLAAQQYTRGLGPIVPEIAALLPNGAGFEKMEFNCFGCDEFRAAVKALPRERNTLILCGMETHICVTQTALSALRNGYLVHVASDAVGSRAEWNWKIGLRRMEAAGAVISSTEMIIYELLHNSGTAAFKEMLKHLK